MKRELRENCLRAEMFTENMIINVCYNKSSCEDCDRQYNEEKERRDKILSTKEKGVETMTPNPKDDDYWYWLFNSEHWAAKMSQWIIVISLIFLITVFIGLFILEWKY